MLTVRVLPREGVSLRAAATTVEVTGVLAAGHVLAGGRLPHAGWLLLTAAAVLGAEHEQSRCWSPRSCCCTGGSPR